jgi:hypothetical protein
MVPRWSFLSNYGRVMVAVARRPDLRLREIADLVGITPRATQTIVSHLVESGFLERFRVGRRNVYQVRGDRSLPDPGAADHDVSDLVGALISGPRTRRKSGTRHAVILGCSDLEFQRPLREFMVSEGLVDRADLVLWPGGAGALTGPEAQILIDVMAGARDVERPSRVLLLAHEGCHAWTAFDRVGTDLFDNVRDVRDRRMRTAATVAVALGVVPESWYLTASGARRMDGPRRRARYRKLAMIGGRPPARPATRVFERSGL